MVIQAMPAPSRVLVTAASGFIGSALCPALEEAGFAVRRAVRRASAGERSLQPAFEIEEIGAATNWTEALRDVDSAVHLAGRAHVQRDRARDSLAEYRRINVDGTRRLAEQAAEAGVRRFVFMSSVKVHGGGRAARPYTEEDPSNPADSYALSKWEAEQELWKISRTSGLEVVVLRPPLVYGPGVKGNFLRLMRWVACGWPLPLASVRNRRSLIYVGNLVEATCLAVASPQAAANTFLLRDGEDVSAPDLVRKLAKALDVKARLVPCPQPFLTIAATLAGRREDALRFTGSLQVDDSRIRTTLGWRPTYSLDEGMARTAKWYREAAKGERRTGDRN